MKTKFLIVLLIITSFSVAQSRALKLTTILSNETSSSSSFTGNKWYVDRDSLNVTTRVVSGDAKSWTHAAKILNDIPWDSVARGDIVYISGGTDSTTYDGAQSAGYYSTPPSGTSGYVTVTKGIDSGHSGDVYFTNLTTPAEGDALVWVEGVPHIKLENLHFVWKSATVNTHNYCIRIQGTLHTSWYYADTCMVENCTVESNGLALGIDLDGVKDIILTNNDVETDSNVYDHEQELVYINSGDGGHKITNNTFIARCNEPTGTVDHPDIFQFTGTMGGSAYKKFIIANNFFYFNEPSTAQTAGQIYTDGCGSCNFYIYNNIFVANLLRETNIVLRGLSGTHISIRLLNNTFYNDAFGSSGGAANFHTDYIDTAIIKNNIFYMDTAYAESPAILWFMNTSYGDADSIDMDYNAYLNADNANEIVSANSSTYYNLSEWQALGNDINSDSLGSITFTHLLGTSINDYKSDVSTPGTDLSAYFTTDINGTKRTSWYKGAIEGYIYSAPFVLSKIKIFLEGPYAGGDTMNTDLNSYLPTTDPYSVGDTVSSIPSTDIVDWVKVELRTGASPSEATTVVATRAAFIKKDGSIVDLDGTSDLKFVGVSDGDYYVVIMHRNHLAVMSAGTVALSSSGSTLYDFTTGSGQFYGGSTGAKDLGSGVWGMIAGDGNGNGQVQNNDSENIWKPDNGTSGYKNSDFNMNGEVQNNDNENYWKPNNGRGSQVP